ncbi:hypothetical protein GCM10009583_30040 [Ornithinicoccus hortensis]|uniref:Uncharacterized protein n=1 Tax=Ornithinicoccus hortensis TaxID=82346 RepID=A0A542YME3_9MICO|nr:hypothetical protein FB467_0189 [Ornithinicoccus hortensis]
MTHDLDHDLRTLRPGGPTTNGLSDRRLEELHRSLASPRGGQPDGIPVRPRGLWRTRTRRPSPVARLLDTLAGRR